MSSQLTQRTFLTSLGSFFILVAAVLAVSTLISVGGNPAAQARLTPKRRPAWTTTTIATRPS